MNSYADRRLYTPGGRKQAGETPGHLTASLSGDLTATSLTPGAPSSLPPQILQPIPQIPSPKSPWGCTTPDSRRPFTPPASSRHKMAPGESGAPWRGGQPGPGPAQGGRRRAAGAGAGLRLRGAAPPAPPRSAPGVAAAKGAWKRPLPVAAGCSGGRRGKGSPAGGGEGSPGPGERSRGCGSSPGPAAQAEGKGGQRGA